MTDQTDTPRDWRDTVFLPKTDFPMKAGLAATPVTKPLQARRGRASYTGERSIGSVDPGAIAIAVLAERYLMEPGSRGLQAIDGHIEAAMADSRWDDMSKWHRVRLRLLRLQQQRVLSRRFGVGC